MDLLDLYHKSLRMPLDEDEEAWVEKLARQYPFYALPLFIKARQSREPDELFAAATQAPNRSLLRSYMEGRRVHSAPSAWDSPGEHVHPEEFIPEEGPAASSNLMFSLVDFEALPGSDEWEQEQTFSIYPDRKPRKKYAFLNAKVKELTARYLHIAREVPAQLRVPSPSDAAAAESARPSVNEPSQEPPHPPEHMAAAPVSSPEEVSQRLSAFLKHRPTPEQLQARLRARLAEESPADATESVEEDEELVTETLARLHLAQQNYPEALRIYQKLRLLFPQKSAYFDSQIQKIEQQR